MRTSFYKDGNLVCENVEAGWLVRFFSSKFGRLFGFFVNSHILSNFYGWLMDSSWSKRNIPYFIKKHDINMNEFVIPEGGFISFNDFFIRKLRPNVRPVDQDPTVLTAPADSKLFAVSHITPETSFFIKNKQFCLKNFLRDESLANQYENGTLLLFRLAPYDYHRYHFPCDCIPSMPRVIHGWLDSVHPIVYKSDVVPLQENERHITMLETKSFGSVTMISVGARLVGKITHTYTSNQEYKKGDEMGYFSFGGSSLVLLFKKGTIAVDEQFILHSQDKYETAVRMGQRIAKLCVAQQ